MMFVELLSSTAGETQKLTFQWMHQCWKTHYTAQMAGMYQLIFRIAEDNTLIGHFQVPIHSCACARQLLFIHSA